MRMLDVSFDRPELDLALDETLLEGIETGRGPDTLRFWESTTPFVVLGVSQRMSKEVHEDACREDGVPIQRRCSAGGCVLQGPGSLNFALALSFEHNPEVRTLRASYCHILTRIAEALSRRGVEAKVAGVSDLAVDGLKVSGNAQKRRRMGILHHGTLLYDVDRNALKRYLREPSDRPEYRGDRTHADFVTTLALDRNTLKQSICEAFGVAPEAGEEPMAWDLETAHRLADEKYVTQEWIRRR
jgi:lipoate---protein ligase